MYLCSNIGAWTEFVRGSCDGSTMYSFAREGVVTCFFPTLRPHISICGSRGLGEGSYIAWCYHLRLSWENSSRIDHHESNAHAYHVLHALRVRAVTMWLLRMPAAISSPDLPASRPSHHDGHAT